MVLFSDNLLETLFSAKLLTESLDPDVELGKAPLTVSLVVFPLVHPSNMRAASLSGNNRRIWLASPFLCDVPCPILR